MPIMSEGTFSPGANSTIQNMNNFIATANMATTK